MLFSKKEDAQKLCEEIHLWLQKNCPGYQAVRWAVPEFDGKELYMVKLPQEYYHKEMPKELTDCFAKSYDVTETLPESFELSRALLSGKNERPLTK